MERMKRETKGVYRVCGGDSVSGGRGLEQGLDRRVEQCEGGEEG